MKPVLFAKIPELFGPHGNKDCLTRVRSPFPLRLSWKPVDVTLITVNKYIAEATVEALERIRDYYGEKFLVDNRLNTFGGSYNDRQRRSGSEWSSHAWALAIDYVPHLGPFGAPAVTPAPIVQAFRQSGFLWGGNWRRPDGMHFTAVIE